MRRRSMFKSILVTLDGSPVSEAVLPHVMKMSEGTDARVTLVTVAAPPEAMREGRISRRELLHTAGQFEHANLQRTEVVHEGETEEQARQRAEDESIQYLEERSHPLRERGIETDRAVLFGDAAEEILEYARRHGPDVIAMATHGRSGISRMLFGSVTEAVVRESPVPVLIVRPAEGEGGRRRGA
jgi:nucleotide-binding universal stress UspA family protein